MALHKSIFQYFSLFQRSLLQMMTAVTHTFVIYYTRQQENPFPALPLCFPNIIGPLCLCVRVLKQCKSFYRLSLLLHSHIQSHREPQVKAKRFTFGLVQIDALLCQLEYASPFAHLCIGIYGKITCYRRVAFTGSAMIIVVCIIYCYCLVVVTDKC